MAIMTFEGFKAYAREFPVLGGLIDCDGHDHWDALGQTTVLFVLSTMPIWLGALIVYSLGGQMGSEGFKHAFYSTIDGGELFMYSTALLAPIFWIALSDPPGARVFPGKVSHIVLIVIISVIAAVFFGLLTAGTKPDRAFSFMLSYLMFFTSLLLLYLGILYHENRIKDPATEMKDEEDEFSVKYRKHRDEPQV